MVDIPHGKPGQPGTWHVREARGLGRYVVITCPHGHEATVAGLFGHHAVSDDGTVSPSVLIRRPQDGGKTETCGWHEFVRLLDYEQFGIGPVYGFDL